MMNFPASLLLVGRVLSSVPLSLLGSQRHGAQWHRGIIHSLETIILVLLGCYSRLPSTGCGGVIHNKYVLLIVLEARKFEIKGLAD